MNATSQNENAKTRAQANADAHALTILEAYQAWQALEDSAERATVDGEEYDDADTIRDMTTESALSIELRGPWYTAGSEKPEADEYSILLSTGGPALRIYGELNRCREPNVDRSEMQVQDWGTPWTWYEPEAAQHEDWDDAFAWFIGCFYIGGEG
jgi:hypothetical protein